MQNGFQTLLIQNEYTLLMLSDFVCGMGSGLQPIAGDMPAFSNDDVVLEDSFSKFLPGRRQGEPYTPTNARDMP